MSQSEENGIIRAQAEVGVSVAQARQWFLSLKDHPQRYRFATHEGVVFVAGDFGEVGARFYTRERFFGLELTLHFELMAVDDIAEGGGGTKEVESGVNRRATFRFKLLRPLGGRIWGAFAIDAVTPESVTLCLTVGAATRLGNLALRFYPVMAAVRGQIRREVAHIKASMERVYA